MPGPRCKRALLPAKRGFDLTSTRDKARVIVGFDVINRGSDPGPTALEGCAGIAFSKGTFARLHDDADADGADADESRTYEPKRRGRYTVELEGFNINAAVRVDGDNDVGREKLARYCARPSI